ncbi:MAG: glycosyltransferase [Clostridiales bacterium]|jgi:glycosyltransferase involved in cell wall biosynthesis|nr:glycosyltransferase [Clostridiales bacterium]
MISVIVVGESPFPQNQTHKDFEVIREDGEFSARALNAGLSKASGEYVIFSLSNHYEDKTLLETLIAPMLENGADISVSDSVYNFEKLAGPSLFQSYLNLADRPLALDGVFSARDVYQAYLEDEPFALRGIGGKLFRRSLFEGLSFPEDSYYSEFYTLSQVFLRAGKIFCAKEILHTVKYPTNDFSYYLKTSAHIQSLWDAHQYKTEFSYKNGFSDCSFRHERRVFEMLSSYWLPKIQTEGGANPESEKELFKRRAWFDAQKWVTRGGVTKLTLTGKNEPSAPLLKTGAPSLLNCGEPLLDADLISIIVPVYNVEKYLRECVESIMNQTYKRLEILLIDDGSKDTSGFICDEYAEKDARIQVVHQKNGGVAAARNTGLDLAKGLYIMCVDSDDYVAPTIVERLYNAVINDDCDMGVCNLDYVFEEGYDPTFMSKAPFALEGVFDAPDVFRCYCDKMPFATAVVFVKLYHRKIFDNLRFRLNCLFEDTFILPDIYLRCQKITCVQEKLYYYRMRPGSITHGKMPSSLYMNLFDSCQNKIAAPYTHGYRDFSCKVDSRILEGVIDSWGYKLKITDGCERERYEAERLFRKEWFETQKWTSEDGATFFTPERDIKD